MPIVDYCRSEPVTAGADESIQEAAKRMDVSGVGCLVVVDGAARPIGIVTDRDLALQVLRRGLDPAAETLECVMSEPVVTITDHAPLGVAARFMRQHGVRRIPVVQGDTGAMVGIVSSDDLVQLVSSELSACADIARQQFPADLRGERALSPGGEA